MISQSGLKSILVPWSFSGDSVPALEKALELAEESTRIHVVHIAAPFSAPDNGMLLLINGSRVRTSYRRKFYRTLPDHLHDRRIRFDVEFGYVARELLAVAEQRNSDLIVMTEKQRSSLSRIWHGNIPGKLKKDASCPVVVVDVSARSAARNRGGLMRNETSTTYAT